MGGPMGGWTDGWTDGWIDGWMDRRMDRWMSMWVNGSMVRWMRRQVTEEGLYKTKVRMGSNQSKLQHEPEVESD